MHIMAHQRLAPRSENLFHSPKFSVPFQIPFPSAHRPRARGGRDDHAEGWGVLSGLV